MLIYVKKKKKCFWDSFPLRFMYLHKLALGEDRKTCFAHPDSKLGVLVSWRFYKDS